MDGIPWIVGQFFIGISEVRRANQTIQSNPCFGGKVMKHQDTLTESIGAHFETGTVGGEGVVAGGPCARVVRCRYVGKMLAVVEDNFEEPLIVAG